MPACVSIFALLPAGCNVAGPSAIRGGRTAYNDVIVTTNNEQVLTMIVRMRYEEPSGLLAVASVTANVRIQGSVGGQVGVGPSSTFQGNLVPLSAGALYEENPTISYTPVQGQEYLRQLLSPLPLDLAVLMLRALADSPKAMLLLIRDVNGIRNPLFLMEPPAQPDDRFARIADLLAALHRRGWLTWVQEPGDTPSFALLLRGEGDAYARDVVELHALLGLDSPRKLDESIILTVIPGTGQRLGSTIEVQTRSAFELLQIAAASVDVPPEDLESGLAPTLPPAGPAVAEIRIRRSAGRPSRAMVAVQHDGWWYSIDGTDSRSKQTFRIMEALLSERLAESINTHAAPILTVPASR